MFLGGDRQSFEGLLTVFAPRPDQQCVDLFEVLFVTDSTDRNRQVAFWASEQERMSKSHERPPDQSEYA